MVRLEPESDSFLPKLKSKQLPKRNNRRSLRPNKPRMHLKRPLKNRLRRNRESQTKRRS